MKKLVNILITILLLSCCLFGCEKADVTETTTSTITQEEQSKTEELIEKQETNRSFKETAQGDIGGGEIVQEKYRQCYYQIFYQLTQLVDEEELKEWEKRTYALDPDETNEMVVKLFIQHFNISKEDFERANLELAKVLYAPNGSEVMMNPKDYANQEMYELYNADIIYTFDDEIINEYYLSKEYPFLYGYEYEEALEAGTYETRTTDWVDIEQMEAEINAKYGAPEVTETTTIPEETQVTE